MPIAYDPGTNTITVVGFTESSPCTFEDIYQADVNNGWGVVKKQNDYQYQIDAKLRIGDGSTETWFKDIKVHVVITPNTGDAFFVANNATFQLGDIDENDNPINGCCLVIPNYEGDTPFYGADNGAWKLYDSEIYYPAFLYLWSRGAVPPTHEIIGCRFVKFMGMRIAGENSVIKDCVFHAESETWSMIGLTFKGQLKEVSDIYSYKMMYGVYWSPLYGASDAVISGLKVKDCQYAIRVYGEYENYSMYLIDADIDNWNIKWENMSTDANKIYRQYSFKVKVTDKDGNPISGVTVEVWDKYGTKVVTDITDSNGETSTHIITYGYYAYPTGNTLNLYSPHRLRISKVGYRTIDFELEVNRPMRLVIPLNAEDYTLDEIYDFLKSGYGILNRETMHKTGSTVDVRFKSKSGDTVKIYVYKPDGSEVVSGANMTELGTDGIYSYELTFDESWGTGDFLIKCVDEDEEIVDAMTVTVVGKDEWFSTHAEIEFVRKYLSDKWEIKNNQLIIYDVDGVTPLLVFDLYDKDGNPSEVNVYLRVPH